MDQPDLLYRVENKVAYITINREAKRNAINRDVTLMFMKYLDQAEQDSAVRVVSITGAGERAFCAGADLGGEKPPEDGTDPQKKYADLLKRLASFPKPTVARVKGYCLAGGTGFMLACDIVV
ncbi:MAG: enoyl-CoA hydratase/isomerase family protein, partial [Desulfobacterales bacterium]|nr:enoyl-CoA hydratase/isomerase family protein [Desulfobacterales bacterium]